MADRQDEIVNLVRAIKDNLSGGGGGGTAEGFYIGTKEERLALEPKNGYVFNQVEEDGVVHRYFYEQGEWVLLANPDAHDNEELIIQINSNDGTLNYSTLTVLVTNNTTGVQHQVEIDSIGEGIIYIPIGDDYTITFPKVEHYVTNVHTYSFTAERYIRNITVAYRHIYSDYDSVAKSIILEYDSSTDVITGGSDEVLTRILEGGTFPGTYVIDEPHKKFAKLSALDHSKFEDGTTYTGTYGNVFRHLPKLYILRDTNYEGVGTKYWFSDIDFTGLENPITLPESWIGVYKGNVVGTTLYSRPNVVSTGNVTVSNFQEYAKTNGTNYGINDYKNWQKLCLLFLAKYQTTNVDSTPAGPGMAASSSSDYYNITTGVTIGLGDATGKVEYQGTGYYQCKLFGIEALWGQQFEFLKGIYLKQSVAYVYDANSYTTQETPERTFTRLTTGSNSFITKLVLGDYFDVMAQAAGQVSGSSASYYCDAHWGDNTENILLFGGSSRQGLSAGVFAESSSSGFSDAFASNGARLCFYGDISEYELLTGSELAALNPQN